MTPQIPNYEIKGVLGEGGMAVVYLAEHRLLHTRIALKLLNREFVHNENIRKRFLSEARNMAKMSHPNIVRVTDLIEEGETVAFVMEYIEGDTLKGFMDRKRKLSDREIRQLLLQMLGAIIYVHDKGLVHRDIKPSNFMITPQGKVKLMDFGIAKQLNPGSPEYTSTGTNQQMGTAMYMSPEQIHETSNVTVQSDIYSLGVLLWQMVTGLKPYDMGTLSTFQLQTKIVTEPLPLTNSVWDWIIRRATEKDMGNRFGSAKEFKEALRGAEKSNAQESTRIEDKTVLERKKSSPITNTIPQEPAATPTEEDNLIEGIIGWAIILGVAYFILKG
jgi:serine/threonine protein kinase